MNAVSHVKRVLGRSGVAVAFAFAGALATASCGGCDKDPAKAEAGAAVTEALVPAPDGLLADVYAATPNLTWQKLQHGVGGAAGILPATAGGVICAMLGLDPGVAAEIDGVAPAYGVVTGDPTGPAWLFALKLNDSRKARAMFDGETARFGSRDVREVPGMIEVISRSASTPLPVAVAIAPNGYLVLARRSDDLAKLAPYATRTLPARKPPGTAGIIAEMPKSSLTTVVKPKLEAMWEAAKQLLLSADERMRNERGGRAPDFGDPKAIVAALDSVASHRIAVVGDLERMRVALDVIDDGITMVASMTPAPGGGPATAFHDGMQVGDTAPVAALPLSSALTLTMRDNGAARAAQAESVEKAVTSALGTRLAEADAKKLHDAIAEWTKGRGEVSSIALQWDEPRGLELRAAARDGDAAAKSVSMALDLARVAPFKEMLRLRDVTTSSEDVPGLGKTALATLLRDPGREGKTPPSRPRTVAVDAGIGSGGMDAGAATTPKKDQLGLAWVVQDGALQLAAGEDASSTLRGFVKSEKKLGDDPSVQRSFRALGNDATAVLVVQPLRFDPQRANLPPAPIVIGLGKKDKEPFVRVDVAHGVLRELARWQMGL